MDAKHVMDELQNRAFWATSSEADFSKGTWTFDVPSMRCGAGPYLIISVRDWEDVERMRDTDQPDAAHKDWCPVNGTE